MSQEQYMTLNPLSILR